MNTIQGTEICFKSPNSLEIRLYKWVQYIFIPSIFLDIPEKKCFKLTKKNKLIVFFFLHFSGKMITSLFHLRFVTVTPSSPVRNLSSYSFFMNVGFFRG